MDMKTNKLIALLGVAVVMSSCSKQDLPYDLEGTEHGVAISISKVPGSDLILSTDMSTGDYKLLLSIPEQQGDISMLQEAQVMAVYTDGAKNKKSAIVSTGITSFPATVTVNIADACAKLGVSTINVGDRVEFTPCTTLKSGTQVNGWSELGGFNNTYFSAWTLEDGSTFSYRVAYTAFAPFQKDKFQGPAVPWSDGKDSGTAKVTQIAEYPSDLPAGVTESDLVGLQVEGDIWFGGDVFKMWINTLDYTLVMPDHIIRKDYTYGTYGTYDGEATSCEGEVDTLNNTLSFYFYSVWGPYAFGDATITLKF